MFLGRYLVAHATATRAGSWAIPSVTAVLFVVAAWVILAPVAPYLAIAKE